MGVDWRYGLAVTRMRSPCHTAGRQAVVPFSLEREGFLLMGGSRPVVLVILDGWGIGRDEPGNAILAARTPTMDRLLATYPNATLRCSGEDVGLPPGQMGNSEVGHLNLGAGFVVYQWISRIDRAIADGTFFDNPRLVAAVERCVRQGTTLHLLGLIGDGGVHAHSRHLIALIELVKRRGLVRVAVHAFTDGRDTSPTSGLGFIGEIEHVLASLNVGRIATVSGRYYAMDRDRRWERTRVAYGAIVDGIGPVAASSQTAVEASYAAGITDEFVVPTVIAHAGQPPTQIEPGDEIVFFNFRADRARQLTEALSIPGFEAFTRSRVVAPDCNVTTMTRYEAGLPVSIAFEPHDVVFPVARVISEAGMRQFHCAETEKYAHVTFFFNGGREEPFPGETRQLIPSPKVATYDLQPEMSAAGVTDTVVDAIASRAYDFVIVNFANCDMVGHTGVFSAAVAAVETADACLDQVLAAVAAAGGVAIVTADHGNAEEMIDRETGGPMTAHTTNPVPVVLVAPEDHPLRYTAVQTDGVLSAVASTVLQLLGLGVPTDMTTPSLIDPQPKRANTDRPG
jgi:2,3-bisphosphoglycerate-independent phosphoglycerate mutase